MLPYYYRKSHCGDKTVVRSSYLNNASSYSGKMSSLYWFRPLVAILLWQQLHYFITFYSSSLIPGQNASGCLPLCNTNIVHTMTVLMSKLESPILHQICTFVWSLVKMSTEQTTTNKTLRIQKWQQTKMLINRKPRPTETSTNNTVGIPNSRKKQNVSKPKLRHPEKKGWFISFEISVPLHTRIPPFSLENWRCKFRVIGRYKCVYYYREIMPLTIDSVNLKAGICS